MPPKPKYFAQSLEDSCVPACLRTVFTSLGKEILEYEIRALCDCDGTGTKASKAIEAARAVGFYGSYLARLEVDELVDSLELGALPITYLEIAEDHNHAVVVHEIRDGKVFINDPSNQDLLFINQDEFIKCWELTRGLTIIVQ